MKRRITSRKLQQRLHDAQFRAVACEPPENDIICIKNLAYDQCIVDLLQSAQTPEGDWLFSVEMEIAQGVSAAH